MLKKFGKAILMGSAVFAFLGGFSNAKAAVKDFRQPDVYCEEATKFSNEPEFKKQYVIHDDRLRTLEIFFMKDQPAGDMDRILESSFKNLLDRVDRLEAENRELKAKIANLTSANVFSELSSKEQQYLVEIAKLKSIDAIYDFNDKVIDFSNKLEHRLSALEQDYKGTRKVCGRYFDQLERRGYLK